LTKKNKQITVSKDLGNLERKVGYDYIDLVDLVHSIVNYIPQFQPQTQYRPPRQVALVEHEIVDDNIENTQTSVSSLFL
jgi:hypothetical protein